MRLLFAGTPAFAATALQALIDAGHEVVLVLTQPDRPAGRGLKLVASDVKILAQKHILTVEQPLTLKTDAARDLIAAAVNNGAEAMIVAAYGLILPPAILALPRLGCLNIHASLLPRWRGAVVSRKRPLLYRPNGRAAECRARPTRNAHSVERNAHPVEWMR